MTPSPAPGASAPAEHQDDVEAELTLFHEISLEEGRWLPAPKLEKATPEATKAHQKKLAEVRAALAKKNCNVTQTIAASHAASTYLHCVVPGKSGEGERLTEQLMSHRPEFHWFYAVEGPEVVERQLARVSLMTDRSFDDGSSAPYVLMVTAGGFVHRVSGDLAFVLRRNTGPIAVEDGHHEPARIECLGKRWMDGKVSNVPVPSFFLRARDLDGDGREEQPAAVFDHALEGWYLAATPALEQVCNVPADGRVTVAVAGVEGSLDGGTLASEALRRFYERRLEAARARAQKIRRWAELPELAFDADASPASPAASGLSAPKPTARIKQISPESSLRLTNECAIDVAQVAAQLVVYSRALGGDFERALADADALMSGFAVRGDKCEGLAWKFDPADPARTKDFWPDIRKALTDKPK